LIVISAMNPRSHPATLSPTWLLMIVTLVSICFSLPAAARENAGNDSGLATIERNKLPEQAQEILKLIRAGGPFKHAQKDGSTFGNFEKRLPKQPRGYYKEYTVPTPGAKNRGARRIVCGGDVQSAAKSTCYYTDDHYNSFKRILE
jgi:ribonuclease T1